MYTCRGGIVAGVVYLYITTNTPVFVGMFQKAIYLEEKPVNSFDLLNPPMQSQKENTQYHISESFYGTEYPNSFFDIIYPNENRELERPTLSYFHGGGFFFGSKNRGDTMATGDSTVLLDDICAHGYNIVHVDYALVPDSHFLVHVIQSNQELGSFARQADNQS